MTALLPIAVVPAANKTSQAATARTADTTTQGTLTTASADSVASSASPAPVGTAAARAAARITVSRLPGTNDHRKPTRGPSPTPTTSTAPKPNPTVKPTSTPAPTQSTIPTSTPTSTPKPTQSTPPTSTPTSSPTNTPTSTPTPTPSQTTTPTPSTNPNAMPVGNLTGWTQTYAEDFNRTAAIGQLASVYGTKLLGYNGFTDTSGNGTYAPNQVLSTHDSMLDYYIHAAGGKYLTAAPTPQGYTGQLYGKYTLRFRADTVAGYKIAFLLWPDSDTWTDGELDFPEGELGQTIGGYAHDVAGNPSRNAFTFNTGATMNTWHTLSIEWTPTRLTYTIDGVSKTTTDKTAIPQKPMHLVLQAETDLNGMKPSTNAAGHVQIDWLTIYKYTP